MDPATLGMAKADAAKKYANWSQLEAVVGSLAVRAASVTIGDSITAAGYIGPAQFSHAWWNQFSISTQNRIRFDACFATPGHTIQQIRDDHLPSVLAMDPKPGSCWILAGTNNMLNAWDLPAMKTAYQEILDALIEAYILPVVVTIPPNNASGTKRQRITIWNAYLRNLAQVKGYPMLDAHSVLTDAATGAFKTGMFLDDDHPNAAGNAAIASLAATDTQLVSRFPLGQPYLTRGADDGVNLVSGGLFTADANGDGIGNSWLATGNGTAGTMSIVADVSVAGAYQRVRKTSGQTGQVLFIRTSRSEPPLLARPVQHPRTPSQDRAWSDGRGEALLHDGHPRRLNRCPLLRPRHYGHDIQCCSRPWRRGGGHHRGRYGRFCCRYPLGNRRSDPARREGPLGR